MLRSKHPLYSRWSAMISRCRNKKLKRYGGRGISVCERWLTFENFVEDMMPTFKPELTLDRRDNNGNYEKSNCRWITHEDQMMNRQISFNVSNETRDILRARHITYAEYGRRLAAGQTHEQAIKNQKNITFTLRNRNRSEYYEEQAKLPSFYLL